MSIGLVVALLAMTSLALGLLLVPLLLRRQRAQSRDAYNLTVYRDQLAEVERDIGRGLLSPEQAEAARAEIGRRILALTADDGAAGQGSGALVAATLAILLLPPAAGLLYGRLGSPGLPDQAFAGRAAAPRSATEHATPDDMNEAVARLADHLKTQPKDLNGWLLLGRSQTSLEHYPEAADAYRHAADLSGNRADITGEWGEAQVLAAGGTVTPAARQAFETALHDPENAPRARYYLALGLMQQGDLAGALRDWRELAASAPADAEWLPLVKQRIAEAAAAASPEERQALIGAMVQTLAARLATQPDDADGWTRLGRSYLVLHEPEKARDAYAKALALRPDDQALKAALAEATKAAGAEAK